MRNQEFSLKHIERRSQRLRLLLEKPERGWIRLMREALGLTLHKLGRRCDLSIPSIAQAERGEVEGKITIETLRKMAQAMNCEFAYAFVPKSKMTTFIEEAAHMKARRILSSADLHMRLEDQKVERDFEERIVKLQKKLILEGNVW